MTYYWGASATAWVAWTAIGTLALATAAAVAIIVGVRTANADRERDDAKRIEDRQHEAELRRVQPVVDAVPRLGTRTIAGHGRSSTSGGWPICKFVKTARRYCTIDSTK